MKPVIEKLTRKMALQIVKDAVAEKGVDYVYESEDEYASGCKYLHGVVTVCAEDENGEDELSVEKACPACLIGVGLVKHGISMEFLAKHNEDADIHTLTYILEDEGYIKEFEIGARSILSAAQNAQDQGETWGVALGRAQHEFDTYTQEYGE